MHRIYDSEADFVYKSLSRLGVRERDLPDLLQDVFVVVHRRLADYDRTRPIRAWLFGICVGLTRNHRRRASHSMEKLRATVPDRVDPSNPETVLREVEMRRAGELALEQLDPEKRAVFIMFEVEGLGGQAIADLLGIPLGTVHSRVHAARKALSAALLNGDMSE